MPATLHRRKISTTISADAYEFLEHLVSEGQVPSLAQAVDLAVERARQMENRARLERDTAAYFKALGRKGRAGEARLESAVAASADEIDFGN